MTARYTDKEWENVIKDVETNLLVPQAPDLLSSWLGAPEEIVKLIDHTLLKVEATPSQIDVLCAEARIYRFKTVCVRPSYVSRAVFNLRGSTVGVAAVISFPHGTSTLEEKVREAKDAVIAGATELDIVLNYPLLVHRLTSLLSDAAGQADSLGAPHEKGSNGAVSTSIPRSLSVDRESPEYSTIFTELAALRATCPHPTVLKLILETSQLNRHQITAACIIAKAARFDFVKTSTGYLGEGATAPNVLLMQAVVRQGGKADDWTADDGWDKAMQVKASGGVRTLADVRKMVNAGASRIGTSAGVWIMQELGETLENGAIGFG